MNLKVIYERKYEKFVNVHQFIAMKYNIIFKQCVLIKYFVNEYVVKYTLTRKYAKI